eukprot:365073-Chlamydomonas_euryale.AAC.8
MDVWACVRALQRENYSQGMLLIQVQINGALCNDCDMAAHGCKLLRHEKSQCNSKSNVAQAGGKGGPVGCGGAGAGGVWGQVILHGELLLREAEVNGEVKVTMDG